MSGHITTGLGDIRIMPAANDRRPESFDADATRDPRRELVEVDCIVVLSERNRGRRVEKSQRGLQDKL